MCWNVTRCSPAIETATSSLSCATRAIFSLDWGKRSTLISIGLNPSSRISLRAWFTSRRRMSYIAIWRLPMCFCIMARLRSPILGLLSSPSKILWYEGRSLRILTLGRRFTCRLRDSLTTYMDPRRMFGLLGCWFTSCCMGRRRIPPAGRRLSSGKACLYPYQKTSLKWSCRAKSKRW